MEINSNGCLPASSIFCFHLNPAHSDCFLANSMKVNKGPLATDGWKFLIAKDSNLPKTTISTCPVLAATERMKAIWSEQWKKVPWLFRVFVGDDVLPSYMGIIVSPYKDPVIKQPVFQWHVIIGGAHWCIWFNFNKHKSPKRIFGGHNAWTKKNTNFFPGAGCQGFSGTKDLAKRSKQQGTPN